MSMASELPEDCICCFFLAQNMVVRKILFGVTIELINLDTEEDHQNIYWIFRTLDCKFSFVLHDICITLINELLNFDS